MKTAVTAALGITDKILLLHQCQLRPGQQHIGHLVDILVITTDHPHTCQIIQVLFGAFCRQLFSFPFQLIIGALRRFDPR